MEGKFWKFHALAGFVLCSLIVLLSCEGDDNFLDQDKETAANAEFAGTLDLDLRISRQETGLTLTQPAGEKGAQRTIVVSNSNDGNITGTISPDAGMMSLDEGSSLDIATTDPINGTPESFTLAVEEAIAFQEEFPRLGEYLPVSGRFTVTGGGDSISVSFLDSPSPNTVSLSLNDSTSVSRDFFDFVDEIGAPVPSWEEKASLSFNVLYLLVEQVFFISETASLVEAYKGNLIVGRSLTFVCESVFPQAGQYPGQPDATSTLSWDDANGNGNVDSGDGFDWLIFTCWEYEAGSALNDLLDGSLTLTGYVMDKEQSGENVLVSRFGFEPDQEGISGVEYSDFDFVNIREESIGSYSSNRNTSFTMNGGLDIMFSRPDAPGSGL